MEQDAKLVLDPTEQALGISTYLSPNVPGFLAVSKARYSDFCVHEVGMDGKIARLESMEPVVEESNNDPDADGKETTTTGRKRKLDDNESSTEVVAVNDSKASVDWTGLQEELEGFCGSEGAQQVISFLQRLEQKDDKPSSKEEQQFVKLSPINDKDKRRELHQWIRSRLNFCARADTVQEGDDKIVRIWHVSFEKKMPNYKTFGRNSARASSRPDKKYLQFVLYKENMDTGAAIHQIQGKSWGKHKKLRVGYAGNKDKRGITSQFVTVPATTPMASLVRFNRSTEQKGGGHTHNAGVGVIRLGNFSLTDDELRLGRLQGNRFDVVLRNVQIGSDLSDAKNVLEKAANSIREHGFINYFGVQRFGKFHDTHLTGIAVLKGDFENAIDIIMQVKEGEREQVQKARTVWQDRFVDAKDRATAEKDCACKLLREFHRSMTSENAILQSLSRFPLDYKRAFSCIPKTMRMMFVHALQSFLWNSVASRRVQMGANVLPGDLVLEKASGSSSQDESIPSVRIVTEDDVQSGRYTLEDVVLPLVGTKTRSPENECGALFDKLLVQQGVTLEMMKTIQDRDLHCAGDYRYLICRPLDVDYNIVEYTDPRQPLLQTDLMKLNHIELETNGKKDDSSPLLLGMVVGFSLPSSSYATIFLRELMKRPTSSEFQRELGLESTT